MHRTLVIAVALLVTVPTADASTSTIQGCYSTAESENTGLSIDVNLGSTSQLNSSDLDAVFDKTSPFT